MIPRRSADQNRQRPHRCSIPERCRPQIRKYAKHHTPTPTNRAERDKVMLAYQDAGLQVARHRDKRSAKPSCRMPRRAGTCPQAQRWSATLSSGKQSNIDPFRLQYILCQKSNWCSWLLPLACHACGCVYPFCCCCICVAFCCCWWICRRCCRAPLDIWGV